MLRKQRKHHESLKACKRLLGLQRLLPVVTLDLLGGRSSMVRVPLGR